VPIFGAAHISWLLTIAAAAVSLVWLCRRSRLALRGVRLAFGFGLAANELVWWVFRYSHEGVHLNNLPLQLCDLTLWVTVLACLTINPSAIEFAYFAGIAGSGMAVLTPDLWAPWPSYPAAYFFLAHGGVIIAAVVLAFGRPESFRPGALWRAFCLLAAFGAAVGAFNAVFRTNYAYLCEKPRNPSLLDWLGPWPIYLAGAAAVGLGLFWLLWLPVRPPTHSRE
jgi:hypothetical integral membrane protein (TIGR02206 family)